MEHNTLNETFKKYYGFSQFRPGQEEVIKSILEKRDTVALMPTGGGKSLCFQLPALIFEGTALVISPLIALMKDQVDALVGRGIAASYINSSLSQSEIDQRTADALDGKIKILYVAPERLASGFSEVIKKMNISFCAVDEAHCVSTWGHDFRPDYLGIKTVLTTLKNRPVCAAFTATATPEVKQDIIHRLGLIDPNTFVRGFDRPNLKFFARGWFSDYDRDQEVIRLIKSVNGSGIVYAGKRDKTEELAGFLNKHGIKSEAYHAGLKAEERPQIQDRFMRGESRIIVATIAFGMGVDKPDVRFVIHAHMPASLENYYQEAGRAGRDGKPAYCVLLHSGEDQALHKYFIEKNFEESFDRGKPMEEALEVKCIKYRKLDKMLAYVLERSCRRNIILRYFGDEQAKARHNCKGCDYCLGYEWKESDHREFNVDRTISFDADEVDEEEDNGMIPILKVGLSVMETVELYRKGLTVQQICDKRGFVKSTILGHLIQWYDTGGELDIDKFVSRETQKIILSAMAEVDDISKLGPIKAKCPEGITYEDIKWIVAKIKNIKLN